MSKKQIVSSLREVSSLLFDAEFAESNRKRMALRARATRLYSRAMRALDSHMSETELACAAE